MFEFLLTYLVIVQQLHRNGVFREFSAFISCFCDNFLHYLHLWCRSGGTLFSRWAFWNTCEMVCQAQVWPRRQNSCSRRWWTSLLFHSSTYSLCPCEDRTKLPRRFRLPTSLDDPCKSLLRPSLNLAIVSSATFSISLKYGFRMRRERSFGSD